MQQFESTETDLDELLQQRLEGETYDAYHRMHRLHYWMWKYHRLSDRGSLRGLRFLLYYSRAISVLREGSWKTDHPFDDYAAELGLSVNRDKRDEFSGRENPSSEPVQSFPNPGNCIQMYEEARPGWLMYGFADKLLYSVDGTLHNCLREELRTNGDTYLTAYECPTFYRVLKKLEISSVADFVSQIYTDESTANDQTGLEPFRALARMLAEQSTSVSWSSLVNADGFAEEFLAANRMRFEPHGEALLFATMLGFLVDELVARATAPNGMRFWYEFTGAVLSALQARFSSLADRLEAIGVDQELLKRVIESLIADCRKFGVSPGPRQPNDEGWSSAAEKAADELRNLGFASRKHGKMNEDEANLVFTASNAIWRWIFFLEQRDSFQELEAASDTQEYHDKVSELVIRWLRRPWGIVTVQEIDIAFRGLAPDDEHDVVPRAFSALTPFLQSDIEDYLMNTFGVHSPEHALKALQRFVFSRHILHTLRRRTSRILHDAPDLKDARSQARTLIKLFVMWIRKESGGEVFDKIEADLNYLVLTLRSGNWLRDFLTDETTRVSLTEGDKRIALDYLDNPEEFTSRLFRFDDPDFQIEECIDTFPPETFSYQLQPMDAKRTRSVS